MFLDKMKIVIKLNHNWMSKGSEFIIILKNDKIE